MAEFGLKPPAALTTIDSALSVAAGGAWTSGSSIDLQDATSGLLGELIADFALTNAGTTDGQDFEAIVQYSPDNTNWPADGEGIPVFSYADSTAGADLTRSDPRPCGSPIYRYARLQYANNNATDGVSVTTRYTISFGQSYG